MFWKSEPSFRSLAFFLRSITVKSLALYEWTNGTDIFGNSVKSGKKEIECVRCHAIKNKIKNHATDKVKKL